MKPWSLINPKSLITAWRGGRGQESGGSWDPLCARNSLVPCMYVYVYVPRVNRQTYRPGPSRGSGPGSTRATPALGLARVTRRVEMI